MVKSGPCFHCGITYTPLWRNGPPEKPVLCNACGSRYRLRGHLQRYLPKHCHFVSTLLETAADAKAINGLQHNANLEDTVPSSDDNLQMPGVSLLANRKDCHINSGGFMETCLWKSGIPRRKRSEQSCHRQTHIERFRRQLLRFLRYEGLSNQSSPSDGELLDDPTLNPCRHLNEIGLGVVLLQEEKLLHVK